METDRKQPTIEYNFQNGTHIRVIEKDGFQMTATANIDTREFRLSSNVEGSEITWETFTDDDGNLAGRSVEVTKEGDSIRDLDTKDVLEGVFHVLLDPKRATMGDLETYGRTFREDDNAIIETYEIDPLLGELDVKTNFGPEIRGMKITGLYTSEPQVHHLQSHMDSYATMGGMSHADRSEVLSAANYIIYLIATNPAKSDLFD